jgi:DNA adenine methylase
MLTALAPHLATQGRLIEPFVGAGSVFMASPGRDTIINDANNDLVLFYAALKYRTQDFVDLASSFFAASNCNDAAYKELRARFNVATCSLERAALLLYLNRFGFNGLYRVNRGGIFNTPFGHFTKTPKFPEQEILAMARRLQSVIVLPSGDFANALQLAGEGDVVYCDPPYLDISAAKKSFTAYTPGAFGLADHKRLVAHAWAAAERGAKVVLSNHDSDQARELYSDMDLHFVDVRRSLAASAAHRKSARELIAVLEVVR